MIEHYRFARVLRGLAADINAEGLETVDIEEGQLAYMLEKAARYVEAVEALEEVLRISDRKHDAWDKAHAALEKLK